MFFFFFQHKCEIRKLQVSGDLNIMYNRMERKLHNSPAPMHLIIKKPARGRADNDDLLQPHLHE